jgi:uncharacterized protein (DUF433 family)
MEQEGLLARITANPKIFGGKPIIRGMRISVELILSLLAQGETEEAVLADYPDLERDDIRACLAYAEPPSRMTRFRRYALAVSEVCVPSQCRTAEKSSDPPSIKQPHHSGR